ncbi:hypothetical protein RchiOBHm_Chr5g0073231 [Rosa chinensis]|uniref:Uncharacterized protein n=1 Tax=Rosa chinensis TaxID=74649 RepID=A0A2P6QKV0_ROSCH|nr:uncharacterized protein LOC112164166 [Rosa chinensis]PRQ34814.1 hypothetical protein RchiOBHm_Chr5g0073231 [Rosa chinensis]
MLQWMGGSRRKVNTSRKSTLNRQKQYFEQRRRQQQHQQQTNGIESYAYNIQTAGKHDKEHQSLDILSLLNLSKVSQEQKSACPNGREDIEVNASRVKYDLSEDPLRIASKMVAPPTSVKFNKARVESGFHSEVASPKKAIATAPDNHRKSFNEMYSKPHNSRTPVEQLSESCVLDFFCNDGLEDDYVEGSPVHEAHVAFSVEGLGKVGMETPVHSPKQPGRTFSYDCSTPLHGARKVNSFKNLKHLDDIEIEMDTVMQDVTMPLSSNDLEFSEDLMDSFSNPKKTFSTFRNCTQCDGHDSKFETYYGGRRISDDIENSNKDRWDGRYNYLEEHSFNEWEHDLSLRRPSEVNRRSVDNMMHGEYGMSDFPFEEPFSPTRFCSSITDKFNILESPSYSKHQVLENDLDFIFSTGASEHTRRKFDFGGVASRPDWSCFATEYDRDNASLLSEESCSSSAVRVNATDDSLPKSTRKHSKRRHGNSYADPEHKYHVDITSMERTQDRSRDFFQQKNIAHGSGRCTNMSKSSKFKPSHHSNTPFHEKSTPNSNWRSEERYMSVDINSGSSSFHQNSCPSAGSKPLSRDPFSAFDCPELHADARPSEHCEPVASSPSGSFISQKFSFHDSPPVTSNIGCGPTKPNLYPCSHDQTPSPDLSAQESFSKAEEGKVKFQPKEKSRLEEENAILNNLLTESVDAASALRSKNKYSECKKAKDADSGQNEGSIKATYMPDHTEEASSFLKSPDKIQNTVDEKEESHHSEIPLPCRSRNKEMEDSEPQERKNESKQQSEFVDSSSQVLMLQSYVLQFLCVQKVLKDAAAQNSMKKI